MAYQKQTWEDLPSTNTPITATRLNHIEDGIADVETGLTPVTSYTETDDKSYSCDYVNDIVEDLEDSIQDIYSTDEVLTNKIWFDKPVYRKVIEFSRNNHDLFTFNISSSPIVDEFVFIDAYVYGNNGLQHGLYRVDNSDQFRHYINGKNQVNIQVGSTYPATPFTGYFIVEYTKTTD